MTTDRSGLAPVNYTTSTKADKRKIVATAAGVPAVIFYESVTSGPAAAVTKISGDGQSAPTGTQLAQPLVVDVTDRYGNGVSGVSVTFADAGAGGRFSADPVLISSTGVARVNYTTPLKTGTVTILTTVSRVSVPASFTVTVH